nr:integrase, catalytic region, zinc finger, CCHC-type, peptidase aspartic, catalytic [Tanacetum cinerariifolium]
MHLLVLYNSGGEVGMVVMVVKAVVWGGDRGGSEGDALLNGSRGNNLYTLSLGEMMASSPICLLSKSSKTKSWLWHRSLSHLNFGAFNHLARHGLVRAPEVIAPIAEVVAPEPASSTGSPSSKTVDQDVPSSSNSQTTPETQTLVISNDVHEDNHDLDVPSMNNDPFVGIEEPPKTPTFHDDPLYERLHKDSTSQGSSLNIRQTYTPFESLSRWTKDHPIANVIDDPSRSVSTRKQL